MLDVEDFDAVFQGFNYTDGLVQQIQEYQHALGGQTFFERLLGLLKIKGMRSATCERHRSVILTDENQGEKLTRPRRHNSFTTSTSASSPLKPHYTTNIA